MILSLKDQVRILEQIEKCKYSADLITNVIGLPKKCVVDFMLRIIGNKSSVEEIIWAIKEEEYKQEIFHLKFELDWLKKGHKERVRLSE